MKRNKKQVHKKMNLPSIETEIDFTERVSAEKQTSSKVFNKSSGQKLDLEGKEASATE